MLKDLIPEFQRHISKNASTLSHNEQLYNIFEGDLLPYIEADLKKQLGPQSYEQAAHRLAPINILRHVIDRLSRIYPPTRMVSGGTDADAEMLSWFAAEMRADSVMNQANEFFNLAKTALIHPFVHNGMPSLRIYQPNMFLVYSTDIVSPTTPTHVIVFQGTEKSLNGEGSVNYYYAYSADEWIAFDSDGEYRLDIMGRYGDPLGINPYGVLPFVYVNRSRHALVPPPDTDMLKFSKLPAVLLTDLNFISMFQSFSIIYGIDLDDKNLKFAPNAFWSFKSDPNTEKTPTLGQLKPQADIPELLNLLQSEIAFWLQTRGIKATFTGSLTVSDAASGVSKMMDEIDTYGDRQKQVSYFVDAEKQLWDLVLKKMNPVWSRYGMIENRALFSPAADVMIDFPEQLPMISRSDMIAALRNEIAAGFTTKKRAIKMLNQRMTDAEIDEMLAEIDGERVMTMPPEREPEETDMEGGGDDSSQN